MTPEQEAKARLKLRRIIEEVCGCDASKADKLAQAIEDLMQIKK